MNKCWILFLLFFSCGLWSNIPSYEEIKKEWDTSKAWGLHTIVDLYNCNENCIKDKSIIYLFTVNLCGLLEMKRYGDPVIVRFGEDKRVAGYSLFQFIETSSITGHFCEESGTAYLDIFSCKLYDPGVVAYYSQCFFKATDIRTAINYRY